MYSEITYWGQDKETGKAIPEYWCEKYKKHCEDIKECKFFDGWKGENE